MAKCIHCGKDPTYMEPVGSIPDDCPQELRSLGFFSRDRRFIAEYKRLMECWVDAFPDVDFQKELLAADQWIMRKGEGRRYDLPRFASNWMCRAQERKGLKVPLITSLPEKERERADYLAQIRMGVGRYAIAGDTKYQVSWVGMHTWETFLPWHAFSTEQLKDIVASLVTCLTGDKPRQQATGPIKPVQNAPSAAPPPQPRAKPAVAPPKPPEATWEAAAPTPLSKREEKDLYLPEEGDTPF
jgi:hypothetical protein